MSNTDQPWGFWVRVKDRESARYAARMAGLPVFLGGLFSALVALVEPAPTPSRFVAGWLIAVVLIITGLLIRSGRFGLVPFAALIMILNIIIGLVTSAILAAGIVRLGAFPPGLLVMEFIRIIIFPVLFLLVMISGLRGWWWLRQNRTG